MHLLMIEPNFLEPLGAELAREASTMSSLHLLQKESKNTYKWAVLHTPQHQKALRKQSNPEACRHTRTYTGEGDRSESGTQMAIQSIFCSAKPAHITQGRVFTSPLKNYGRGGCLSKKYTFPGLKPLPQQDVFNEPHFPRGVNRHSLCLCFCLHAF